MLDSLGLASVQHRRIGDRRHGSAASLGLSGGERRRLSVALELVTQPKILLADEPTTGLDSAQAENVVGLIKTLARHRHIPAICSLHQPRASIWKKLDSFILMAPGGKMCYMGDRKDATKYFSKLGYHCPPETNPAEFFIDIVSIDTEDPIQAAKDLKRIDTLHTSFIQHNTQAFAQRIHLSKTTLSQKPTHEPRHPGGRGHVGLIKRFAVLFLRAWRQNIRDNKNNFIRLFAAVGQAFLFSTIFKGVKPGTPTPASLADRTALISFGVSHSFHCSLVSMYIFSILLIHILSSKF